LFERDQAPLAIGYAHDQPVDAYLRLLISAAGADFRDRISHRRTVAVECASVAPGMCRKSGQGGPKAAIAALRPGAIALTCRLAHPRVTRGVFGGPNA